MDLQAYQQSPSLNGSLVMACSIADGSISEERVAPLTDLGLFSHSPRALRMRLQEKHALSRSMRACSQVPLKNGELGISYNHSTGSASFTGTMKCGSPLCYQCYYTKRLEAADKASKALSVLKSRGDGQCFFVTLTTPTIKAEDQVEGLNKSWDAVNKAVRRLCRRWGVETGYVLGLDFTVIPGRIYGFHQHLHLVLVVDKALLPAQEFQLKETVFRVWFSTMKRLTGSDPKPEAQKFETVEDFSAASSVYSLKAKEDCSKLPLEILSLWNKTGKGLSWRAFTTLAGSDDHYVGQYRRILAVLAGRQLVRVSRFINELAGEFVPAEEKNEEEKEVVSRIRFSETFFKALNKLRLKAYFLDLVEGFYKENKASEQFQKLLELAAISLLTHREFMTDDWIECLRDSFQVK